jgi:hypothetical protein
MKVKNKKIHLNISDFNHLFEEIGVEFVNNDMSVRNLFECSIAWCTAHEMLACYDTFRDAMYEVRDGILESLYEFFWAFERENKIEISNKITLHKEVMKKFLYHYKSDIRDAYKDAHRKVSN